MRSRRAAARARRARRTRARPAGAAPPLARRGRGRAALEHGQEPAAAGGLAPARLRGGPLRSGAWRTLSLCRTSARRLARRQPIGRRRLCPGQHLVSDGRCVADARAIRHDSPAICAGAGRAWPAPEPPALWSGTAAAPSPAPGVSGISNGDACSRDSSAGLRPPRAAWAGSDAGLRPASAPAPLPLRDVTDCRGVLAADATRGDDAATARTADSASAARSARKRARASANSAAVVLSTEPPEPARCISAAARLCARAPLLSASSLARAPVPTTRHARPIYVTPAPSTSGALASTLGPGPVAEASAWSATGRYP